MRLELSYLLRLIGNAAKALRQHSRYILQNFITALNSTDISVLMLKKGKISEEPFGQPFLRDQLLAKTIIFFQQEQRNVLLGD